jgi:cytochrome c oxidase subunit 4
MHRPPRAIVLAFAALLALLALTVTLAYQPLGLFNAAAALIIATVKAALVAAVFMELAYKPRALTVAFAGAGFFWLGILLWLALSDFATRPNFPPRLG